MAADLTLKEIQQHLNEAMKANKRLFFTYDYCIEMIENVCGITVNKAYLIKIANRTNTFLTGVNANAPFPRRAPVDADSFIAWLTGKGTKVKPAKGGKLKPRKGAKSKDDALV